MKKMTVLFLAVLLSGVLAGSRDETPAELQRLLGAKRFSEALSLISHSIRSHANDPLRQAIYIKSLGDFYKDVCGCTNKASMNYRRVLNSGIPADHPLKRAAGEAIGGIKALETKFREENAFLRAAMARANRKREPAAIKGDISRLKELAGKNPGYYLLHEVYYVLGLNYQALDRPGKVYRALKRAMEIKPGIVFYLPVKWRAKAAGENYIRALVNDMTRGLLWLLLAAAMAVFYISRPWKWLRLKHIVPLIVLVLSWWIVFTLSHALLGAVFEGDPDLAGVQKRRGMDIRYLHAAPGAPGSEVTGHLFWYGVIGVAAVFVFSTGTRHFKRRKLAAVLGGVYGFLLFLALSSLFYMNYCDKPGSFKPGGKGALYYAAGSIHFDPGCPEPSVLTNPSAYPDLEVANITDPYLRDWILKYCTFTEVPPAALPGAKLL